MNISFHLLIGYAKDVLPQFLKDNNIGGLVTDFSPLRTPTAWVNDVTAALPKDVPMCQVYNITVCYIKGMNKCFSCDIKQTSNMASIECDSFFLAKIRKNVPKTCCFCRIDFQTFELKLNLNPLSKIILNANKQHV